MHFSYHKVFFRSDHRDDGRMPYTIVAFTYLWTKSVPLSFIVDELGVAQHTAVDWSSFHREVVYDDTIVRHEKLDTFFLLIFFRYRSKGTVSKAQL